MNLLRRWILFVTMITSVVLIDKEIAFVYGRFYGMFANILVSGFFGWHFEKIDALLVSIFSKK